MHFPGPLVAFYGEIMVFTAAEHSEASSMPVFRIIMLRLTSSGPRWLPRLDASGYPCSHKGGRTVEMMFLSSTDL